MRAGDEALILRGDGRLSRCRLDRAGLGKADGFDLVKGRCWAAPTLLGDVVYARSAEEITAVRLSAAGKK